MDEHFKIKYCYNKYIYGPMLKFVWLVQRAADTRGCYFLVPFTLTVIFLGQWYRSLHNYLLNVYMEKNRILLINF